MSLEPEAAVVLLAVFTPLALVLGVAMVLRYEIRVFLTRQRKKDEEEPDDR